MNRMGQANRPQRGGHLATQMSKNGQRRGGGFTLIDVLVSLVVIALLVSILMPALSAAREAAERVACSSNVRQIGLGIVMHAEDYDGSIPASSFKPARGLQTQFVKYHKMMAVREYERPGTWDGLGWLYADRYIPASEVYYCPSHWGNHPRNEYAGQWVRQDSVVVSNYHYRGFAPGGINRMWTMPVHVALVADGMETQSAFNHQIGANVLRADNSLSWFSDSDGRFFERLPRSADSGFLAGHKVHLAWLDLDDPDRSTPITLNQAGTDSSKKKK